MRVLFIFILIIFCSCHGDYADLGNGYIWVERTIGKKINEDIGTFEYVIYPDIVEYNVDEFYIIAHQTMINNDTGETYIYEIAYQINTTKGKESDSLKTLFNKMMEIQDCYWIINKNAHKIFGPMRKSDFYKLKSRLKINMNLESTSYD